MTTLDTRRSTASSFWGSSGSNTLMTAFTTKSDYVVAYSDTKAESAATEVSLPFALLDLGPEKPLDQREFVTAKMSSSETNDVLLAKSLQFNYKPFNSGNADRSTAYLHEDMRLNFHLDPVIEPEGHEMRVEIRDSVNHFWNVWTVNKPGPKPGEVEAAQTLQSDPVKIGFNAQLGASTLTLSFTDIVTGARTNVT